MLLNLLLSTSSTAIPYPDYSDVWNERPILSADISTRSTYYAIKSSELKMLIDMWGNYTVNEKNYILEQLRKAVHTPEVTDVVVELYKRETKLETHHLMLRILTKLTSTDSSQQFLKELISQQDVSEHAYRAYIVQANANVDLLMKKYQNQRNIAALLAASEHEGFSDVTLLKKVLPEIVDVKSRLMILSRLAKLNRVEAYALTTDRAEKIYFIKQVELSKEGAGLLIALYPKQDVALKKVILHQLIKTSEPNEIIDFLLSELPKSPIELKVLLLDALNKGKLNNKQLTKLFPYVNDKDLAIVKSINSIFATYPHKAAIEKGLRAQLGMSDAHKVAALKYMQQQKLMALRGMIHPILSKSKDPNLLKQAFYTGAYLKINLHPGLFKKMRKNTNLAVREGAAFFIGYTGQKNLQGHLRYYMSQDESMSVREQGMLGIGLSGAPHHKQIIVDVMNYLKETKKGGPVNSASVRAYGCWAIKNMQRWDAAYATILENELTVKIIKIPGEPPTYDSSYTRHNAYLTLCTIYKKRKELDKLFKKSRIVYKDNLEESGSVHFEAVIAEGEAILKGEDFTKEYVFDLPEWKLLLDDSLDKE